jgi:HD-GYP domain-containing protein (c-di-GMP phosphodiesterase class II)
MDKKDALASIARNSGTQFDPQAVEAFLRVADQDLSGSF